MAKRVLFSLAVLLSTSLASAESCAPLIQDALNWISQRDGRYTYHVGFTLSSNKAPAKFVSHSSGSFSLIEGGAIKAANVSSFFSDRAWCPELPAGMLCTNYQPFNYKATDKIDVRLQPTGTGVMQIVLKSWGNATYNVPLSCTQGLLYGVLAEPNGTSMVTMSLRKYRLEIPR